MQYLRGERVIGSKICKGNIHRKNLADVSEKNAGD